ncbi:hypothetical protein [Croceibacter atlanticus]|uniref:hypothetical protein n=1 Tax=Croceibacter atlanticus TaxID=313588 RepID=UPI0030DA120C|tara:strand:+ start:119973 stop:120140 length:168 start_codon:yes stop_codon:yes gene_type:complete
MKNLVITLLVIAAIVIGILTFISGLIDLILGVVGIGIMAILVFILWGAWKIKSED